MSRGSTGKVLLVDDELLIRIVAAEALAAAGFEVVDVDTGEAAIALLDGGLRPALLVTDVMMPGSQDGIALAQRARRLVPALPVITASGAAPYSHDELTLAGTAVFLPKPYTSEALASLALQLTAEALDHVVSDAPGEAPPQYDADEI